MVKVSLVIATYNRGEKLLRTLESLTMQVLDRALWEVMVVNNNSADNTQQVAESFAAQHPEINMKVLFEAKQGVSSARNCGIESSVGEYIVIADDDELLDADFLSAYYDFFENYHDAAGGGGQMIPHYEAEKPEWMSSYTESPIAGTLYLSGEPTRIPQGKFFIGGNMALRRSALEKYGLFNPDLGRTGSDPLGGEEKDLYKRMEAAGESMYYVPRAKIYHIIDQERLSKEYFKRLCRSIGRSEQRRTRRLPGGYAKRLVSEVVKWGGTLVLAVGHTLSLHPARAKYLIIMRREISRGLLEKE